jgi:hypothetical protein
MRKISALANSRLFNMSVHAALFIYLLPNPKLSSREEMASKSISKTPWDYATLESIKTTTPSKKDLISIGYDVSEKTEKRRFLG